VVTVLTPATTVDFGFTAVLIGRDYNLILESEQSENQKIGGHLLFPPDWIEEIMSASLIGSGSGQGSVWI
jgi:hypothetical protein